MFENIAKKIKKGKDMLFSELREDAIEDMDSEEGSDPNSEIERKLAAVIGVDINNARTSVEDASDETGLAVILDV